MKDWKEAFREVNFFLRIHRHLPDANCGGFLLGNCFYRKDGVPINIQNDYVEKLQENPEFIKKEQEVAEAVSKNKRKYRI